MIPTSSVQRPQGVGKSRDADALDAMMAEEFCGRQGRIDAGGTVAF